MTVPGEVSTDVSRWLHPGDPDPDATARLFLLHHSGGSAALYGDWLPVLPSDVAVQRVQLPGRQERLRETPYDRIGPLVDALVQVLGGELDGRPYALFGHSMGALVAYRVTVALERAGWPGPALIAASGWSPATAGMFADRPPGPLDDADVLRAMRALGSLPPELDDNPELLALVMPAMRADLAACASYRDDTAVVGCPIVSYSGRDDPLASAGDMRAWLDRTPAYLGNREFPGDHFFLSRHALAITTDLVSLLRRHAVPE